MLLYEQNSKKGIVLAASSRLAAEFNAPQAMLIEVVSRPTQKTKLVI